MLPPNLGAVTVLRPGLAPSVTEASAKAPPWVKRWDTIYKKIDECTGKLLVAESSHVRNVARVFRGHPDDLKLKEHSILDLSQLALYQSTTALNST